MRVDKKAIFTSLDTQWHLEEEVAAEKKTGKEWETMTSTNLTDEYEDKFDLDDLNQLEWGWMIHQMINNKQSLEQLQSNKRRFGT